MTINFFFFIFPSVLQWVLRSVVHNNPIFTDVNPEALDLSCLGGMGKLLMEV